MDHFSEASKVWIYMSSREFSGQEVNELQSALNNFCREWTAHGADLKAKGEIRFNRFIILMVDETSAGASGCSIDKSVHFIQAVENEFQTELFNRLLIAWKDADTIRVDHISALQTLYDSGAINPGTIVFNNTVTSKKQLDEKWMLALKDSWMFSRIVKEKAGA